MIIKANEQHRKLILDYCKEEPSINLFIIGDIELFGFESEFQDVWIQMQFEEITGVILRFYQNFIIYSKSIMDCDEVISLLDKYKVDIISGKASVLNVLYPKIKEKFSYKEMCFAELDSDKYLLGDISNVVTANPDDAKDIAISFEEIEEFEVLYPGGFDTRYKQISNRIKTKEGIHMFIKHEQKVICHGNTAAETSMSAMIGGVMSLKEYRKKGNAKKIVSALCKHLLKSGKKACLFYKGVECENLFKSLGFKDVDKWIVLGGVKNE